MATKKKSASKEHTKSVEKAKGIGKAIHLLSSEGKSYRQIASELGVSKGTISYHLGENQRSKTTNRTKRYRSEIDAYLQKQKSDVPHCPDCGEKKEWFQMDFDHVRGVKKFSLSQYHRHTQSLKVVQAEVAKCDIVCACCHRMRTYMRALEAKIERESKE